MKNFGGFGNGLVDITGIQRVFLNNETFIHNGENTIESLKYMTSTFTAMSSFYNTNEI